MKPDEVLGPRWAEQPPDDPEAARVGERLRRVVAPAPLGAQPVERIAQRLASVAGATPLRWTPRSIGLMAAAAMALLLGGYALLRGTPARHQPPVASLPVEHLTMAAPAAPTTIERAPAVAPPAEPPSTDPRAPLPSTVAAAPHVTLRPRATSPRMPARKRVAVRTIAPSVPDPPARENGLDPSPETAPPSTDTPPPAPPRESTLAEEQRLLGAALRALRGRDGPGALTLLDQYRTRFVDGALLPESRALRVDALLMAGRGHEALTLLDAASLDGVARGRELRVVRGELRAQAGRLSAAEADFSAALTGSADELEQRARYGRASCRARRGDIDGASDDLHQYLVDFPGGRFAEAVRQALAR